MSNGVRIEEVFSYINRVDFLPPEVVHEAHLDIPLPIGYGQTNSQPSTVKQMLEWLDVQPGQTVLDVGAGSGWTSALLSQLVGKKGKVIAVEKVPELVMFGKENCQKLKLHNVEFKQADNQLGWPHKAPYDRILVSAAAHELPQELIEQLAEGGTMVMPVQSSILKIHKSRQGKIVIDEHPGFAFVPLL